MDISNQTDQVVECAERLKERGHQVCVSQDAGRFLCNFIYFLSLKQAQEQELEAKADAHVADSVHADRDTFAPEAKSGLVNRAGADGKILAQEAKPALSEAKPPLSGAKAVKRPRQGRWHSLFVHVPSFSRISKEAQLDFLADVLDQLGEVADVPDVLSTSVPAAKVQYFPWLKFPTMQW